MFNKKKEDKMNKEIVVLRRTQFISCKPNYVVEKTAKSLDEAAKYKVALELLNDDKAITYVLFNEVGQFDVDTIQKVESEKELGIPQRAEDMTR
jgi:hypothetical protein